MKEVKDINEINAVVRLVENGIVDIDDDGNVKKDNVKSDDYTDGRLYFCAVRDKIIDNKFNDILYMFWYEGKGRICHCYRTQNGFTTKSGFKSIQEGDRPQPVLIEGLHKHIWGHGMHKGEYDALVQVSPARIKRATKINPKTGLFDYDSVNNIYILNTSVKTDIKTDNIGINLHRTSRNGCAVRVNEWSAGCQVFADSDEFNFMLKTAKAARAKQLYFSYFIFTKDVYESSLRVNGIFDVPKPYSSYSKKSVETASSSSSNNNINVPEPIVKEIATTKDNIEYSIFGINLGKLGKRISENKIFPKDNNNVYIDLKYGDIEVKVMKNDSTGEYYNPRLKVDKLNISNKSYATMGVYPELISYSIPIVFINNFMIPQTNITNFCLDYSSFVPQVMVEFVDISNELLTTNIPKPGSYIKVFIGGYPKTKNKDTGKDDDYYRPIRQNFVITNISKTNKTAGEYQNYPNSGNPLKYKITGILNVPLGFAKIAISTEKLIAMEALKGISNFIGLGFATNFVSKEKVTTLKDKNSMRWVNTQNKSVYDFLREITQHSVYSKYTFFTSFIDQHYYLNYVECRSLLSRGGKKEDTKQIIYNCIMPEMDKYKTDVEQKESYYFLTNSAEYKGWTNYIEEYYELNDGYSMMTDGFTKVLTYTDSSGTGDTTYTIVLKTVDNLKRDKNGLIEPLPETVNKDIYIPLNLMETTNPEYTDENREYFDCPVAAETNLILDNVDTSNTYLLYPFASVQNDFQMKNLKKCGLSIRLQNYNPSITKYSRIWVDLYDMNRNSMTQIRKDPSIDNMEDNSQFAEYLKAKNDNIIAFDEEISKDTENQVYNRSLSGWYVITEMKISYNTVKDFKGRTYKKLQTHLILNRIDYRPSFYSEYEIAKNAIERYRIESSISDKTYS